MDLIILNLEIIKDFKKIYNKKTAAIMVETIWEKVELKLFQIGV
jgi:hypothetical protein